MLPRLSTTLLPAALFTLVVPLPAFADGANEKVHILDRDTLDVLTSFGDGGRQPGAFYAVHSIATDSKGNIFTTETYRGQRVQKFAFKGVGPVVKEDQGVLWPKNAKSPF